MGKYSFDFLVIDEAHHSTSPSYRKVIDAWPDCRVLGVTATPSRLDGRGLGEVFEKLVTGPSIQELIDDGFLTSAVSYGSEMVANMANVRTTAGDYNIHDLEEALDKSEITGSAVEHYASLCPGAPAIAFCTTVRHSHDVAKQFSDAGYRAFPIDGKMPMSLIRDRINGLRDGSVQILTSCELVSEGLDVVGATAAILLRPTKSKALFLQQCGRVLRPLYPKSMPTNTREQRLAAIASSYKPKAIILDHSQNVWRHGLPEEVQEWSLDARKKKPSTTIGVRSCPQCFAYCPIGRKSCLKCGFVFTVVPTDREIPQVAGQLTKLDAAMMSRFRRKEEGLCRTYEDLRALGERRGYNIKWAYRRALERGFIK
jgi:superfamily II DNA or RNA helicase